MRACIGAFLVLIALVCQSASGWYPDVPWIAGLVFQWILPMATVISGWVLLMLIGHLQQRDRFSLALAIFGAAGTIMLGPLMVAKLQQDAFDAAYAETLQAQREAVNTDIRRRQQELKREIEATRIRGEKDRFVQYEGRLDLASLAAIRQLDAEMQDAVEAQTGTYEAALKENPALGPSAWATFRTLEQLETERIAHQRLYSAARTLTAFIDSFEETYTRRIEELGLKPPADRIAIAEMERIVQAWEQNQTYLLRRLDVELLSAALAALNVLHEQWGQWTYSPREERLSFESPDAEAAFSEAMIRVIEVGKAVEELQKED